MSNGRQEGGGCGTPPPEKDRGHQQRNEIEVVEGIFDFELGGRDDPHQARKDQNDGGNRESPVMPNETTRFHV